ncbi:MAG: choice-of-anchor Q domain-containing protein [Dokdonella sp.]
MNQPRSHSRQVKLVPLALCICATLPGSGGLHAASANSADGATEDRLSTFSNGVFGAPANTRAHSHDLAAFFAHLDDRSRMAMSPPQPAATRSVSTCADSGTGSLRAAIGLAGTGDVIDMSQLACSTITLASDLGLITVADITLRGPTAHTLTIDAAHHVAFLHTGHGTLTVSDLAVKNGNYGLGGCIATVGNASLTRVTVSSCVAIGYGSNAFGGGVFVAGNLTLASSTLSGNTAGNRCQVLLCRPQERPAAIDAVSLTGGGGAYVIGNATITASTISGNVSICAQRAAAGALFVAHDATLTTSTISGNTVSAPNTLQELGGGIVMYGATTLNATTVDSNHASVGGGVVAGGPTTVGALTLLQSTVSTNSAASAGGVLCGNPVFNLNNSTVAFNLADGIGGGGIVLSRTGALQLKAQSSIVGKNSVDIGATLAADIARSQAAVTMTGANNLVVAVDGAITLPAGTLRSDPQLASLAANGGPTRTHALQSTSPAVNTGNNNSNVTFDQRGSDFCRVSGVRADIGAYERQSGCDSIFRNGFDP